MDPNSGMLYNSVEEAKADGVTNPIEVSREEVVRLYNKERTDPKAIKKRKAQKLARKKNR